MQREQIQLQGIQFPQSIREDGASLELLRLESQQKNLESWIVENHFSSDRQWGFISQATTKQETVLLSLAFRRVVKTSYRITGGRLEKNQSETTEPEVGELHFRRDGLLELYSMSSKQKNGILRSLEETFEASVNHLSLSKNAMLSLMKEATEISSVSLSGMGNPFFSDATLSGADPLNSRTFKELMSSGNIKSFRGKFYPGAGEAGGASNSLLLTVQNNCKVRFYAGGQNIVAQSDIEDFMTRLSELSTAASGNESA